MQDRVNLANKKVFRPSLRLGNEIRRFFENSVLRIGNGAGQDTPVAPPVLKLTES
jgi:hypothetical protein